MTYISLFKLLELLILCKFVNEKYRVNNNNNNNNNSNNNRMDAEETARKNAG